MLHRPERGRLAADPLLGLGVRGVRGLHRDGVAELGVVGQPHPSELAGAEPAHQPKPGPALGAVTPPTGAAIVGRRGGPGGGTAPGRKPPEGLGYGPERPGAPGGIACGTAGGIGGGAAG